MDRNYQAAAIFGINGTQAFVVGESINRAQSTSWCLQVSL
jgi:hypothetical protein